VAGELLVSVEGVVEDVRDEEGAGDDVASQTRVNEYK